jgi:hypothetical protein
MKLKGEILFLKKYHKKNFSYVTSLTPAFFFKTAHASGMGGMTLHATCQSVLKKLSLY